MRTVPRRRAFPILVAAVALCLSVAGCVSRNVESLSREEADAMPPPPAPLSPEERVSAAAAAVPGIDGTISVDPSVASVPEGVLYVIVRVNGREGGAPLAVKQLPGGVPTTFRVSEDDAMMPNTPLIGDLDIIVRLDQDGNAFSSQPGDLEGRAGPVTVGQSVDIVLSEAQARDEANPR